MPRRTANPNCYIIDGPNGTGKTTFATEFLPLYANCRNFINADLIARGLSPFDPDAGMLRAGRTVLERIAEFTESRADFAFETTLSGRSYVPRLRCMKKAGFRLHMFYLWIPSPELALLRIRDRVESGGTTSRSPLCGGVSFARSATSLRFTAPCSIRSGSLTTLPMNLA